MLYKEERNAKTRAVVRELLLYILAIAAIGGALTLLLIWTQG